MEVSTINPQYHDFIDAIECAMGNTGAGDFEVSDFFCGGMYIRTIAIPKGSYLTSKIHRLEHPFMLAEGIMTVFTEDGGEEILVAPYMGITKSGTRRFARADEFCRWTTVHRTDKKTVLEVEEEIIMTRVEHLKLMEGKACHGSQQAL